MENRTGQNATPETIGVGMAGMGNPALYRLFDRICANAAVLISMLQFLQFSSKVQDVLFFQQAVVGIDAVT
jgi:hypothetical protein